MSDRPEAYADPPEPGRDLPMRPGAVVQRAPYTDAVAADDEMLVLVGRSPLRLTGLGATIWQAATSPTTETTLRDLCITEHGNHPHAARLVEDAVRTLLEHGVLRLTEPRSQPPGRSVGRQAR